MRKLFQKVTHAGDKSRRLSVSPPGGISSPEADTATSSSSGARVQVIVPPKPEPEGPPRAAPMKRAPSMAKRQASIRRNPSVRHAPTTAVAMRRDPSVRQTPAAAAATAAAIRRNPSVRHTPAVMKRDATFKRTGTFAKKKAVRRTNTFKRKLTFKEAILLEHNVMRTDLKLSPLVWDDELEAAAKAYAQVLATLGRVQHSPHDTRPDQGENLCRVWGGQVTGVEAALETMDSFEEEREKYIPGTAIDLPGASAYGHYTQAVWEDTKRVGAGFAKGDNGTFVVCRYTPPGNVSGGLPYVPRKSPRKARESLMPKAFRDAVLAQANQARAKADLSPLRWDVDLESEALAKAEAYAHQREPLPPYGAGPNGQIAMALPTTTLAPAEVATEYGTRSLAQMPGFVSNSSLGAFGSAMYVGSAVTVVVCRISDKPPEEPMSSPRTKQGSIRGAGSIRFNRRDQSVRFVPARDQSVRFAPGAARRDPSMRKKASFENPAAPQRTAPAGQSIRRPAARQKSVRVNPNASMRHNSPNRPKHAAHAVDLIMITPRDPNNPFGNIERLESEEIETPRQPKPKAKPKAAAKAVAKPAAKAPPKVAPKPVAKRAFPVVTTK